MRSFIASSIGIATLALTACASAPGPVTPVTQAPAQAQGISGDRQAVGMVDLGPHGLKDPVGNHALRARSITLQPGGAVNEHPHAGRPGVVRVIKGTVVEVRGAQSRTLKAGEYWFENADTTHWFRNPSSTETAELWVVDLVPKN